MLNALSVDLEDWFNVNNLRGAVPRTAWPDLELRVVENGRQLLRLLARHDVQATFFVLGWIAERVPELVREIEAAGHEIATHGYSHRLLTELNPRTFEEDIKKALEVTGRCASRAIVGYRAPSFSLTEETMWAADVLARNGIRYSSSVFPIGYHPDYGMGKAPLTVYRHNDQLVEFPLSAVDVLGVRVPCGGGGYFRVFPYALTKLLLRKCVREGRPVNFYIHPWEVDPGQPKVKLPWSKSFRHYFNLARTEGRLDRLLRDFRFGTIREVLGL